MKIIRLAHHISYNLKDIDVNDLWTDYLQPLLYDYIRGMYNENSLMDSFKVAYLVMTMNLLRIRDNSQIKKEAFYKINNLETKILNVTLKNLEKEGVFVFPEAILESEDLEQSQMILQDENGVYKTSNIMGFIGYGDERLVISSRFSDNHED